jgi:sugar phosphate isomerase/epimerase
MPPAAPTAESWPIAAAMLPFGGTDSRGGPIHDADAEEWARHLRVVRRLGFTEVDPTDTWVRIADLEPSRLEEFRAVLADVGLTVPAVSTSRRSVMDPERGAENLAYSHRLLDAAAALDIPLVSFGFFQALTPAQNAALWFWLVDGWRDDFSPEARARAASLIRELAEHAAANGQQISLEMYEDTYVGTCDDAVAFLEEVGHPACGLNPDLGNFVRLHRPLEPVQDMLDKVLPHANYWHVKNYARDEDPAIGQALDLGYRGAFLCEHYGNDAIGMIGRNRAYVRELLGALVD